MKKLTLAEMQAIAQERGGFCLSESYENSQAKLRWRCAQGHEWKAKPSSVKLGSWCRQCAVEAIAAKRRISFEEIQALARSKGGECLSKEYVGNKDSKLQWRCAYDHVWHATLGKVRNDGSWCPTCARLKRFLTLEDMKALAHAKGGECLSEVYHGLNVKLRWRCSEGHEWEASPGHIRNGDCWCPKCAGCVPLTLKDMHALARSRGGECLSNGPVNSHIKLQWRCANGHEWMARPADIKNSGSWCPTCGIEFRAAQQRASIEEIQALARSRGGVCLSTSYDDSETNLRWRCARGHEWEASLRNVKHNKSWCPVCGTGVSERICRGIFEALFQVSFPKARPDWLKNDRGNWMELDGYSEDIGIAFEYHGIQHYAFKSFFHNEEDFWVQRQQDDRRRAELCRTKSIRLFEIPYTIYHEDIESFVREASKEMGITIPRQEPVDLQGLAVYADDPLEELKKLAQAKGGECLSTGYVNRSTKLRWRCSAGHEWEAPPSAVKSSGQWCPRCGINRRSDAQRLSIDDMHALARSRGDIFLSNRYEGSSKKHRWRCAQGHEWEATPNNIKHREQWCPICAITVGALKRRLTIDEMKSLAQLRGGSCLSEQYLGNNQKLRWRCSEGHEWEATPHSIKDGGQWCPQCGNKRKGLRRLGKRGHL